MWVVVIIANVGVKSLLTNVANVGYLIVSHVLCLLRHV